MTIFMKMIVVIVMRICQNQNEKKTEMNLRPTVLIGAAGVPRVFTEEIIKDMAREAGGQMSKDGQVARWPGEHSNDFNVKRRTY